MIIMASSKYWQQKSIMRHSGSCEKRRVDRKINRLKAEMAGIRKQQQSIRQGQREIRERFEEIESECDELKKETELVSQASDKIQLRLDIMLKILKARRENDFAKAADLTCSLRLVFRIFFSYFFFNVQLVFASIG
ncbi:PREDICTED: uncharacterized protein LOC105124151 [Populus euphratica]|uniref:Uncharacterized protein LOC105124151 n=1 Tax=Populus euphratica TaxID=75702 RepID=A0AAJ6U2X6_POPEU|nr:PREDICTED: uncharacterized protein LOC105124151 [Populus euphratica]